MMKLKRLNLPALLCLFLLTACGEHSTTVKSGLPVVDMKIGSGNYHVEVAADEYSREHGLMERDSMPSENGMIFVFPSDTENPFWMHHTRMPLDIVFISQDGKVVSVQHMKAYDESSTYAGGMYRYAVELNAGATDKNGVKAGDSVEIPTAALHH